MSNPYRGIPYRNHRNDLPGIGDYDPPDDWHTEELQDVDLPESVIEDSLNTEPDDEEE